MTHEDYRRALESALESEEYLAQVSEYVLLNPVRAGLCDHAAEWPWSATRSGFPDA